MVTTGLAEFKGIEAEPMAEDHRRIGILSDTHGQADRLHCGDIGGEAVVDALAGLDVAYVFGNMDGDRLALARYIRAIGQQVHDPFLRTRLGGREIAMIHGDDLRTLDRLICEGELDYLFHGHSHLLRDERIGRTRVINPGALHRARTHTAAVLDLGTDELEIIEVAGASGPGGA
jgi:hypothetical protein